MKYIIFIIVLLFCIISAYSYNVSNDMFDSKPNPTGINTIEYTPNNYVVEEENIILRSPDGSG